MVAVGATPTHTPTPTLTATPTVPCGLDVRLLSRSAAAPSCGEPPTPTATPTPTRVPANVIAQPDTVGDVGRQSALRLDRLGRPVVAYYEVLSTDVNGFPATGRLKLLRCGDSACSPTAGNCLAATDNCIVAPDAVGNVGQHTSVALDGNDRPIVSYYDVGNARLKVLRCGSRTCESGSGNRIAVVDSGDNPGVGTSLVLDRAGNPVVSYHAAGVGDLRVLHCGNTTCTAGNSITAPDTAGVVGEQSSLRLDFYGNPVVSYHQVTSRDLRVLHCGSPNC